MFSVCGEFFCIFDVDFVFMFEFLCCTVFYFMDPMVGMV